MRKSASFTLIELLVVIAIIGILAGLLIPVLGKARDRAKHQSCASNLHQVSILFQGYLGESKDIMPYAASMPSLGLTSEGRIVDVLTLSTGSDNAKVFRCPMDTVKKYYESEGSSYQYESSLGGVKLDGKHGPPLSKRFIMLDYEPFHGAAGFPGSTNYLFADGHVGDIE
jgi:prepilin-type N-terminal cleavage/methylation domain-containing protein/prepilin-type processing-associated H-X9-DG protein